MCTVSWLREVDGYQLFFNRDESVTRQKTRTLSNPSEGLMLLKQYSKNKDVVELSKEWDN